MNDNRKLAESLVDWWQLAGLEWDFSDTPNDWLADDPPAGAGATIGAAHNHATSAQRSAPTVRSAAGTNPVAGPVASPVAGGAALAPAPVADIVLPADLPTFQQMWAQGALGPDGGDGAFLAPHGPVGAALMIITAAPERDDTVTVLSGRTGELVDNIARSCGLNAASVYRSSYFPRVVLDNRAVAGHVALWRRIALHHIALVRPAMLVVAGDDTARALLGHDPSQKPPVLHFLNHDGGTVKTVILRKPSLMLHRAAQEKFMAWQSLQLLLVE